ncbi:MAG: YDG domain-containing protein, partial [Paludibacteraceae bacterium]|nr:YDG domain-containing protein [Paludibacteraceae bacterium]
MKKNLITEKLWQLKTAALVILMSTVSVVSKADGSKDMFPKGGEGYRASLWSAYSCKNTVNPFPTVGVMKVYAKAGEHILLGSSAMGKGDGAIDYFAPDGTKGSYKDNSQGYIKNRAQELAGPNFNGTIENGFTPISITVTEEQEGVWEIYFRSPTYTDTYNADESTTKYSIENWSQNNNDGSVMAFDISVSNAENTALIPGRVYTNVLNLNVLQSPNGNKYASCWYSNLYILTDVGYLYKVNTNGQNPHYGAFFSNNKGIQKKGTGEISPELYTDPYSKTNTGYQSYQGGEKSFQSSLLSTDEATGYIYDPRIQDNRIQVTNANGESVWKNEDVTHKIFFSMPSNDLPETAKAVYAGTVSNTWLKTKLNGTTPAMGNLTLNGAEANTTAVVGPEGMSVSFNANVSGGYTIDMQFGEGYTDRQITGTCIKGINNVKWDGKDGDGKKVSLGEGVKVTLSGEITTAEVHFPFIDLENNENGFILEHIDDNGNSLSDIIYWDDSNIQSKTEGTDGISALEGKSSATGAHRWTYSNSTGDDALVDTWSYVKGIASKTTIEPNFKHIDLAVNEAGADVNKARVGQEITYTVKIANLDQEGAEFNGQTVDTKTDADSAAIGIWLGEGGFVVTEIAIVESDDPECKVLAQPNGTENSFGYISLKNGKTATVTVKGYATDKLANTTMQAQCFVMRPGDIFEIDSKNLDDDGMPSDPTKEYEGTTNNNIVLCEGVAIEPNGRPVIDDTETGTLNVAIKAEKGKDYSESGIMLPIAITDPENEIVTTTLSGDDAANFAVKNGNLYYIGTAPTTEDVVTYTFTATSKDESGATTVRNILVTVFLNDGALNDSHLDVVTDTIMYGQPVSEAIKSLITADTTAEGVTNGSWVIRNSDMSTLDQTAILDAGVYTYEFSYYAADTSDFACGVITHEVVVRPREVTITSGSTEKVYDGTPLTNDVLTIGGDGFYGTEGIEATDFASIKNAGEVNNTFTINFKEGTNSANYKIDTTNGTLKVTAKELTVDGTAIKDTKVYDGNTECEVTETGTIVADGIIAGEDVKLEKVNATYEDKKVGDDKAVTVTYTLGGEDAKNYFIADVNKTADITTKELKVNGTVVDDKDFDNTTDATVSEIGTLSGVVEGDDVTLENATAKFESEEVGNQKADVKYTLSGEDADNYTLKDTVLAANIRAVDANFDWTYNNPVYGENVGTGEEVFATYKGSALEAGGTYTYFVDGTEVQPTDLVIPGLHKVKVIYTDGNGNSAESLEQDVTFGKAVLTPVTEITKTKVYDGNATAAANLTDVEGKVAETDDVNVNITASNYDNKNVGEGKTITVTYELTGENADYYTVKENDVVTDGAITKQAKDAPVVEGGKTSAPKANDGKIEGLTADMEISIDGGETWTKADSETGLPVGKYTIRYAETDTTFASDPATATIIGPSDFWNIINPDLTYGVAVIGGTESAEYKYDPTATIAYELDGVPAEEGTVIPAGTHSIKATYTDPETSEVKDTTFTCEIAKKELSVEGGASEPKVYDGNTKATLATMGTLTGKIGEDDVTINEEKTVATFDDKNVGTGKDVEVIYTLAGKDADNYFINPVLLTDGVITKADKDAPVVYNGRTSEAGADDGKIVGLTPEMEISTDGGETWANADPEAGLPAGEYAVRYPETDTTKASAATTVSIYDPSAIWEIVDPALTYGEAIVGVTEKGAYKADPTAAVEYTLDGVPAEEGTIIPAGDHDIKVAYTNPETGDVIDTTFTCHIAKKELNVNGGASEPKVYDGNTNATLAEMGTLSGKIGDDEVTLDEPKTVATFDNKNVGTSKDVKVEYALAGKDADNYFINPVQLNDGVITKADKDAPAVNNGETSEFGANDGHIPGLTPEMEISTDGGETWANADPEAGLPVGEYAVRYPETDTTNASTPVVVTISNPRGVWDVENPALTYGEATVGGTEKGALKDDPTAPVTYIIDGVPAEQGAIIPAGTHNIKVTYTNPETGDVKDTTFVCEVAKKELNVNGGASEPKVYDGNTNATLAEMGTLSGKIGDDEVTLDEPKTVATFDNKNVGTSKDVKVEYALAGKDADNYFINPVQLNDGVITKADKDAPAVNNGETSEFGANDGHIPGLTPEMEISTDGGETWANADPEAGLPVGEYAVRYPETDTTNASTPVVVTISNPRGVWDVENPALTYGEATVGGTEKGALKDDPTAPVTYIIDGVPAEQGAIIPAGTHNIKVTYTNPETGDVKDTTFVCEVAKKELNVNGGASEPKVYDGNTNATLAEMGTLSGKIGDDEVT